MGWQRETKRPIHRFADADARRNQDLGGRNAVVTQLKRRAAVEQVKAVVGDARKPESLAQAAGAGGKLAGRGGGRQAAIHSHRLDAGQGFQRAEEDTASLPVDLATHVHAKVAAVDGVDVGVACGAEENGVPGSGAAERVGSGVGRGVVRPQVAFSLDNAAGEDAGGCAVDEKLAQKRRGDGFRPCLKEGAGQWVAGKALAIQRLDLVDGVVWGLCYPALSR